MTLEFLTQYQKVALEGEVARNISTARHNPEVLFRYYIMLKKAPKEVIGYIKEVTKELVEIDANTLNKVELEALADTVPLWIWEDRVIADIKLGISLACAEQIGTASLNKKLVQKKILKSAFIAFCREGAVICPSAIIGLCRKILDDESIELGFLEDTCFSMIEQVQQVPDKPVTENILMHVLDLRSHMMSYQTETEILDKLSVSPLITETIDDIKKQFKEAVKPKVPKQKSMMVMVAEDDEIAKEISQAKSTDEVANILSDKISQIFNEHLKSPKAMKPQIAEKWAVYKNYRDCETVLRTFNSEKEADDFIGLLEKQYPELLNTCTFEKKRIS